MGGEALERMAVAWSKFLKSVRYFSFSRVSNEGVGPVRRLWCRARRVIEVRAANLAGIDPLILLA